MKLVAAILICEATGIASGLIGSARNNPWFDSLAKPSWFPPPSLFGPVWTTLYLLMGIALWLIWKSNADAAAKKPALLLFALQLLFNFLWSIIFFRFRSPAGAFADIILLDIALGFTIYFFGAISKPAAWLLVPYLAWVSFASVLNLAIWTMN
jgi:translocator protein